jgi:hypothetical protein
VRRTHRLLTVLVLRHLDGDQGSQPYDDVGGEPGRESTGQHLLALVQRRAHDPLDPPSRRRFDPIGRQRYALAILRAAGVDEPLTWSPPSDCVRGLHLLNREPYDIDLNAVGDLVELHCGMILAWCLAGAVRVLPTTNSPQLSSG